MSSWKLEAGKKVLQTAPGIVAADWLVGYASNTFPNLTNIFKDPHFGENQKALMKYYFEHPWESFTLALEHDWFLYAQPAFFAVNVAMVAKHLWEVRKKNKFSDASRYGAYGTARWALSHEILDRKHFTTNIEEEGTLLAMFKGKPIIQHEKSKYNRNVAVFGGSGAGKTQSYIIPNILNTKKKSIIAIDPKGELYELTSEEKRKQGYEIRVINFSDMDISDRYNPLKAIKKDIDAQRVAKTLVVNSNGKNGSGDPFWANAEEALISSLILYVLHILPESQHHLGSVYNILTQVGDSPEKMDTMFETLPKNHIVRQAYGPIKLLEDKVRSSVFVSAAVTLNGWKYESVRAFTSESDLDLRDIGLGKKMVYLILPVADDTWKALISCFIDQLFQELYRLADGYNNKLPVSVRILMDELANIGKIPNLAERTSTCRSYGIECSLVLQSYGQLVDRYGKEQADELIGNCDFKLFLNTTAYATAEYFSKMIGKTTIQVQNSSHSKSSKNESDNESKQYASRPLMHPDELMRLDEKTSETILIVRGKQPMMLRKAWITDVWKDIELKRVNRDEYEFPPREPYDIFEYEEPVFLEDLEIEDENEEEEIPPILVP